MFRDRLSLWKSTISPPSLRVYPQKSLWPVDLSPKTIRPEPIYIFKKLPSPQLKKTKYPPNWKQWSKWTKKRAGSRCQLCGRRENHVKLEAHHIKPLSEGGSTNPENLASLCQQCHRLCRKR